MAYDDVHIDSSLGVVLFAVSLLGLAASLWRRWIGVGAGMLLCTVGFGIIMHSSEQRHDAHSAHQSLYRPADFCGNVTGSVHVAQNELASLGFGPDKRLVVINLTEIGSVHNVPLVTKEHATLQAWGNGSLIETRDIGIELKGSASGWGDPKWSMSFEFVELDGGEWEDVDDDFPYYDMAWSGNEEEWMPSDYVLRTDIRDASFASDYTTFKANPQNYKASFVELVYAINGIYSYEGVFLLVNAVKRSSYQGPKIKADKNFSDISMLVENSGKSTWKNEECRFSCETYLYSNYPKCSKWSGLEHHLNEFDTNICNMEMSFLDLNSTMKHFLFYQWALPIDMMKFSVYFYLKDGQLHGGPFWDITACEMPLSDMNKWWASANWLNTLDWWHRWLKYPEYVQHIKTYGLEYLDYLNQSLVATTNEMLEFESNGYFDMDSVRWPRWGKQCRARRDLTSRVYDDRITKNSHKEDIEYFITQRTQRMQWMKANIQTLSASTKLEYPAWPPDAPTDTNSVIGLSLIISAICIMVLYYTVALIRKRFCLTSTDTRKQKEPTQSKQKKRHTKTQRYSQLLSAAVAAQSLQMQGDAQTPDNYSDPGTDVDV